MIRDPSLHKIYQLLYKQASYLTVKQRGLRDAKDPRSELEQLRSLIFSAIEEQMSRPFPNEQLLQAESQVPEGENYCWRFHPIEEEQNFISGSSRWTLAVAGYWRKRLHKVLVIEGNRNDYYWARRNGGCYGKIERLRVSDARDLKYAALGCDIRQGDCPVLPQLRRKTARIINSGSDLLNAIDCAAGRVDLFTARASPQLILTASVLIEEAGGLVCDEKGQPLSDSSQTIIAANAKLFSALLKEIG